MLELLDVSLGSGPLDAHVEELIEVLFKAPWEKEGARVVGDGPSIEAVGPATDSCEELRVSDFLGQRADAEAWFTDRD